MSNVKISPGNSKMGSIKSISLPAVVTCRQCDCHKKCYAKKLERLRPNVANAYQNNLEILKNEPERYWREVEAAIMTSRYFRFHVSGDIPDDNYFCRMISIAWRNPHCEILCFTKRYEIVNNYITDYLKGLYQGKIFDGMLDQIIPKNIHIIYSGWVGLEMANPFSLPEAHVRFRDGTTTAADHAFECGGNCTECAVVGEGCWSLKQGQQVIFNEH